VNSGDVERLVALSSDDVEVGGPRGSGRGSQLLREWFARAGIRLQPRRVYVRDERVVVEQGATWPGQAEQTVASAFEVRDGKVERVIRHATLADALDAAGLDEESELQRW
jgi:hypothetical protein